MQVRFGPTHVAVALALALIAPVGATPSHAAAPDLPRRGLLGAVLADEAGAVRVRAVVPGSAAASAQLRAGDVVRSIDGHAARSANDVVQTIRALHAGAQTTIRIVRDGAERTVAITLGAPANENDPSVRTTYEAIAVQGTLRRTLIDVPATAKGPLPAMLLVGGIGCFSVDVAADPDDAYLRVARDVAKAGFLTMRLEKSGVGDSQGPPCHDVDFRDESASYAAAIEALRRDPRVDARRIYLLGHSIGTVIAPQLALEEPIAGVIAAEAVGRTWFEYELANTRRQLELGGDPPDAVDAKLASKERCMHRLLIAREPEASIERDEPDCRTRNGIYPVAAPYLQQVAALNIIAPWTRIAVPVLVIYGGSDYVVAPADHERIASVVNAAHPGYAVLRRIDAMDHPLRVAATASVALHDAASGVVEPYQTEFSDVVVAWLSARSRSGRAG